jgi:hypothetical protein
MSDKVFVAKPHDARAVAMVRRGYPDLESLLEIGGASTFGFLSAVIMIATWSRGWGLFIVAAIAHALCQIQFWCEIEPIRRAKRRRFNRLVRAGVIYRVPKIVVETFLRQAAEAKWRVHYAEDMATEVASFFYDLRALQEFVDYFEDRKTSKRKKAELEALISDRVAKIIDEIFAEHRVLAEQENLERGYQNDWLDNRLSAEPPLL